MVAGTFKYWNVELDSSKPLHERSCCLASFIAASVAQWTETARVNGGSPEAAKEKTVEICSKYDVYQSCQWKRYSFSVHVRIVCLSFFS